MVSSRTLLSHIAIILVRPKIPENIGAAARICWNMGINRLILVRDCPPEREQMAKMATHKAAHLIDNIEIYRSLPEALETFTVVIGTTARKGRQRFVHQNPRETVEALLPLLPKNQAAILFGPEDTGLTNEDLKHCHMASAIPTADFSSINLAQAVAIHCYEIYLGIVHAGRDIVFSPELATSHELESMYTYVEDSLLEIEFMEDVSRTHWMGNIRHLLGRIRLTSKDANIIRGICKKFLYHQKHSLKR